MTGEGPEPNYGAMSDEQLVFLAQGGDTEAERVLVGRFMPLVERRSFPYFMIGAENEDLIQEGSIGLCSAIRDFDAERGVGFRAYADVCITNNVFAAIKRAARKKHNPLNDSLSLDKPIDANDKDSDTFGDRLNIPSAINPEELAIKREREQDFTQRLTARLTELEMQALTRALNGMSYKRIAEELQRSPKAVDNALQRVRKKLAQLLAEEE